MSLRQTDTLTAGYNKDSFTSKADNVLCLMANTIIAMLTQIQDKLDLMDKQITNLDRKLNNLDKTTQEKEYDINQLTERISNLNLGSIDTDKGKKTKT